MNRNFGLNRPIKSYQPYQYERQALSDNLELYSRNEGYTKGNMFRGTYIPYKNYQPQTLSSTNEQEALFLKMSESDFAAHDLNLYLDLHPQDGNALNLFNQYRMDTNRYMMEYENKFGPINISSDTLTQSPFMWEAKVFPWNEGGR